MEAEHSFGNWLEKSGRREEVVILSKCGHPDAMWNKRVNEKEMRKDLKKSLEELKTDYIDIYMLHRDDPDTSVFAFSAFSFLTGTDLVYFLSALITR